MVALYWISAILVLLTMLGGAALYYRRFPLHLIYKSKVGFEGMLDAIGDPLAVVDSKYIVRRVNKAYIDLVNKSFSESIGVHCYSLLRHRDSPCTDCKLHQSITGGGPQVVEHSLHPSGSGAISISFSSYPSPIAHDPTIWTIEHVRDITALEQLKIELEEKNRSLAKTMRHLKAAQQSIRDELKLARQIQQGILPHHTPDFKGLKLALTYHPVADVGGDIYDFIQFSPQRLGIFIGDASGHGLSSAFVGTISKMSLYNHSSVELPTNKLLSLMNHDLISNIHTSHYLTCFWGIFDLDAMTFDYSRAGHPVPVIVRRDGKIIPLGCLGTFIGILEDATYEHRSVSLERGDRIYLFTDGIYETLNRSLKNDELLGYDEFVKILAGCNALPFGKVVPSIQRQLSAFRYEDDYTLIAIEITGNGSSHEIAANQKQLYTAP